MSEAASAAAPQAEGLLCRGVLYQVLAACLRPPGPQLREALSGEEAGGELAAAAEEAESGSGPLHSGVEALTRAAAQAGEDLDPAYQRLFGHTARGRFPPYETEYGPADPFFQAQEMADLGGFYRAFGLVMPPERRERNDHLSVELEFLSFLCRKEAYLLLGGRGDQAAASRQARRAFLRDHTARFARTFASSLVREAGHPFYRAVGELCGALLEAECRILELQVGPEFIPLRPADEREVPMGCGSCSEAAELPGCVGLDGGPEG